MQIVSRRSFTSLGKKPHTDNTLQSNVQTTQPVGDVFKRQHTPKVNVQPHFSGGWLGWIDANLLGDPSPQYQLDHLAENGGDILKFDEVISEGYAAINEQDTDPWGRRLTPLMRAIQNGHRDHARLLVSHGAAPGRDGDITYRDAKGNVALDYVKNMPGLNPAEREKFKNELTTIYSLYRESEDVIEDEDTRIYAYRERLLDKYRSGKSGRTQSFDSEDLTEPGSPEPSDVSSVTTFSTSPPKTPPFQLRVGEE